MKSENQASGAIVPSREKSCECVVVLPPWSVMVIDMVFKPLLYKLGFQGIVNRGEKSFDDTVKVGRSI